VRATAQNSTLGKVVPVFAPLRAFCLHVALPDGQIVLLTVLVEGQRATILQLPAEPKTVSEAEPKTARLTLAERHSSRVVVS
jgi:hypothetical protein